MKFIFSLIAMLLFFSSCFNSNTDGFEEECPYDFAINGHFLKVPIEVLPHKMTYSVGDTIQFVSQFSDSIEDVGAQEQFLIKGFPFEPVSLLYRFYDDQFNFDSGFQVNQHNIEDQFQAQYFDSSDRVIWFRAVSTYENGIYEFRHTIILDKPGRYVMLNTDLFVERESSGNADLNDAARAIEFEGKCTRVPLLVVSIIEGDDHMEEFMDELLFLDNNVYRGQLFSRDQGSTGPLDIGSLKLEFNGLFCFEVTE